MAEHTLAEVRRWDKQDSLRDFRGSFCLPKGVIYLDGNSLGPPPRAAPGRIEAVVRGEWGDGLIRSWQDAGWLAAPARIGAKIAGIVGAAADEVIVADSTSVNLFKLLAGALQLRPDRSVILSEPSNFPTDLYIAEGVASLSARRR